MDLNHLTKLQILIFSDPKSFKLKSQIFHKNTYVA